ncbi:MAG: hypothetical protein WCD59_01970, partial [Pseudolabrys sp.]
PANMRGLIWDWGKSSEQRASASTAVAGGNEVRRRNLRGVRSTVCRIAQWGKNSAEIERLEHRLAASAT